MNRILIVDDEESIRNVLRMNLTRNGYEVAEASSGKECLKLIQSFQPQLVLLDLGLPDGSGAEVLKEIRGWSSVPIIVLTVADDERTKVQLLESGADDYVTKPFGLLELMARVHVALRHYRSGEGAESPVFESGDLRIELANRKAFLRGIAIHLTATEMNLLKVLARGRGQLVPQDQILKEVWGPIGMDNPHYLRIYIAQLRKKLETSASSPEHILTEPGVGYRLV